MFVSEFAIDAISLYELHKLSKFVFVNVACISILDDQKQSSIDRIKQTHRVFLATDNDDAGNIWRRKNSDLQFIISINKSWNQDLIKY